MELKFHDVRQNTDEWLGLRLGKLTGSSVPKVMANYGKAFGEPAKKLAVFIALEQITGKCSENDSYSNSHMERGHTQEPLAIALYEDQYFTDVSNGGFFEYGNHGCSPDGLVYDDGMIEVKSVVAPVHLATIKRDDIDPTYKWQIYFNIITSRRNWIDFVSYCADFPYESRLYVKRVYRDDLCIQKDMLLSRTADFFKLVEENKRIIMDRSM